MSEWPCDPTIEAWDRAGALAGADAQAWRAHLEGCARCRALDQLLARDEAGLRQARAGAPDPALVDTALSRMWQRVDREVRPLRPAKRALAGGRRWWMPVAAAAVFVVLVTPLWRRAPDPQNPAGRPAEHPVAAHQAGQPPPAAVPAPDVVALRQRAAWLEAAVRRGPVYTQRLFLQNELVELRAAIFELTRAEVDCRLVEAAVEDAVELYQAEPPQPLAIERVVTYQELLTALRCS